MPRRALQFAVVFAAGLISLHGQQSLRSNIERTGLINGIPVPGVEGAPFSATAVVEFQEESPDGDMVVLRTINILARDSHGRTRRETRQLMPESFHGSPPLLGVRIYDPKTHIFTIYDPALRLARRRLVPEPISEEDRLDPSAHKEDLGLSTFDGLATKGTRLTRMISAKASGIGARVETALEVWYCEDLHLDMLVRYSDPRVGVETIGISNLKREEPPPSSFEIPAGYKILDVTPSAAADSPAKDSAIDPVTPE
jgi:hypothetical protein